MTTGEACHYAKEIFGQAGCAHTVKYVDGRGHFALDYRIGVLESGKFVDRYRGRSYEACFDQYQRESFVKTMKKEHSAEKRQKDVSAAIASAGTQAMRKHSFKGAQ